MASNKNPQIFQVFFLCLLFIIFANRDTIGQPLPFLADSVTYLWPTDASRQISSTFAETRAAHLHAGLDIRTMGREGFRVFATRDGVIHRVGINAYGYGNVIYMKHGDGSYSVYAHLNRFEPNLQALADSIRLLDYSPDLDLVIEEHQLFYKQGEVIGYTGSTGAGPPHLHFEIRTPDFDPINPLLTNLSVVDNIPPVFSQLAVEFLSGETLHLERHQILAPKGRTGRGHVNFGEITVQGPVGLAVNVHDRANQTPNVYAVHSLTMIHESDTLFHSQVDYFTHQHARNMFLDRSYPILSQIRRGFQRLYLIEGNQLPIYRNVVNRGVLEFDEGRYPIQIVASDIYGNKQTAEITIRFEGTRQRETITYVPAYPKPEKKPHKIWVPWQQKSPFPVLATRLRFGGNKQHRDIKSESVSSHNADDEGAYFTVAALEESSLSQSRSSGFSSDVTPGPAWMEPIPNPVKLIGFSAQSAITEKKLTPHTSQVFHTPDQTLWMQFPKHAVYDTLDIRVEVTKTENTIRFSFEPDHLPLQHSFGFNYILPPSFRGKDRLALFVIDRHRNRRLYRNSSLSNGVVRAELREITDLILIEDRTPPWVGQPRFERNLAGNQIVTIPVQDRSTGIDYARSVIRVNGQRGLVEYNPDTRRLIYVHPEFTPQRTNRVEYEVFDGAGNQTSGVVNLAF